MCFGSILFISLIIRGICLLLAVSSFLHDFISGCIWLRFGLRFLVIYCEPYFLFFFFLFALIPVLSYSCFLSCFLSSLTNIRYAFSALVRNQMIGSIYTCGSSCECMFVTSLVNQCKIDGSEAAAKLGYGTENWLSYVSPLELRMSLLRIR